MLRLQPEAYLIALGFLGEVAEASLTLTNVDQQTVAYKVKASSAYGVQLTNHKGVLERNSRVEVTVTFDEEKVNTAECKLQVLAAPVGEQQQVDWSQGSAQILRVIRVLSNPEPPTIPRLKSQGHPSDTRRLITDLVQKTSLLKQQVEALRKAVSTTRTSALVPAPPTERWVAPGICGLALGLVLSFVVSLTYTM